MSLDIAESIFFSWLKHVRKCQIVQTNWQPSSSWSLSHEDELKRLMTETSQHFKQYEIYGDNSGLLQIIHQAEIDVLGFYKNGDRINTYAIDVAYHGNGLNYGPRKVTVGRVIKKYLRAAMCLHGYFNIQNATIIFASPKIGNSLLQDLKTCKNDAQQILINLGYRFNLELYANDEFKTEIIYPIINNKNIVNDNNELFARCVQLLNMYN